MFVFFIKFIVLYENLLKVPELPCRSKENSLHYNSRKRIPFVPYAIRNQTGCNLKFMTINSAPRWAVKNKKPIHLCHICIDVCYIVFESSEIVTKPWYKDELIEIHSFSFVDIKCNVILHCIVLHCIALNYIVLHYLMLHCIVLFSIVAATGHTYPALFRMEMEGWIASGKLLQMDLNSLFLLMKGTKLDTRYFDRLNKGPQ